MNLINQSIGFYLMILSLLLLEPLLIEDANIIKYVFAVGGIYVSGVVAYYKRG